MNWQERLEASFRGTDGVIGTRVRLLQRAESKHARQILQDVHGFTVLMDCFQDFALETIEAAAQHHQTLNVYTFALVTAGVRRSRVALNEFYNGYYYDAASLLRAVYEVVLYLGAALHGYIRYDAMSPAVGEGRSAQTGKELEKLERKTSSKVDRVIRAKMLGGESGLSEADQKELDTLYFILHSHVHKSSSSVAELIVEMMREQTLPPVTPRHDTRQASIFCNSATCIAWGLVRVLPSLSLPSRFADDWSDRYQILDHAFGQFTAAWERPAGPAFIRFVDQKLSFDEADFTRLQVKDKP